MDTNQLTGQPFFILSAQCYGMIHRFFGDGLLMDYKPFDFYTQLFSCMGGFSSKKQFDSYEQLRRERFGVFASVRFSKV